MTSIKYKIGRIGFLRTIHNRYREHVLYKRYHTTNESPKYKGVCVCIDGLVKHGGLGDRIFGIIHTFALCKIHDLNFKIFFNSPFDLTDFLAPNRYDWYIDKSDVVYSKESKPIIFLGDSDQYKKYYRLKDKNIQYHVYANISSLKSINDYYGTNFTYDELFEELFRPSELLKNDLERLKENLPKEYVSGCFRHRNIFGDFAENKFSEVSKEDQERIINLSKEAIKDKIKKSNLPIVITSDSVKFLREINGMENVYTINSQNGTCHMDYVDNASIKMYEQSFLDFFVLGGGIEVNLFLHKFTNQSGFPRLAALCFGKPFNKVSME